MNTLFISYASDDQAVALEICALLEAQGVRCWIAPRDVAPGAKWDEAIVDAISNAGAFLLVLTAAANESPYVGNEVNHAFAAKKPIFTFRVEDVQPSKSIGFYLARHHWTDGFARPLHQTVPQLAVAVTALLGASESAGVSGVVTGAVAAEARRAGARTSWRQRWHAWRRAAALATAAFAGAVTALAAAATWTIWTPAPAAKVTRFAFDLPDGQFTGTGGPVLAISPDAAQVVFVANAQMYLRRLDDLEATVIAGPQTPNSPVFSPDGQWVAYYSLGALHKIPVGGGAPVRLCTATALSGLSWDDDTILFGQQGSSILAVPAAGGEPQVWVKPVADEAVDGPQLLPGGDALLFSVTRATGPTRWDSAEVVVFSRATGERKVVLRGGSAARYVQSGHILYAVGANVMAVPFDLNRLEVTGTPVPVLQDVMRAGNTGAANFAVAGDGTLVYAPGTASGAQLRHLVWVDRDGREEPIEAPARPYNFPRLSPDGARVAVDADSNIWTWEFARQTLTRLTFDDEGNRNPVWTPDGRRIAFGSTRAGTFSLFWQPADGSGRAERLLEGPQQIDPRAFTPDGDALVYREITTTTAYDLHLLTSAGSSTGKPQTRPLAQSPFQEDGPDISPDGRWLAYASDESGQPEVYVRPFPNADAGRWQVSTQGGTHPVWARNGDELFYSTPSGSLVVVPVQAGGVVFSAGNPRTLFEGKYLVNQGAPGPRQYDVHPDGTRFLRITAGSTEATATARIVVVQNWFEELKRLVEE